MADPGSIAFHVAIDTAGLANSLRDLADKIDPQPPTATAEDLRGAQAEIDRLNAVIDGRLKPSDALVEKVARAIYESADPAGGNPAWDNLPEWHLPHMMDRARAVLAAIGGES